MHLTPQVQAMMLLTVSLGKSDLTNAKPLSNNEWSRFAIWLKDNDLEPATLLKGDLQTLLSSWIDRSVSVARLEQLMGRGAALGLALEKWQRAGLWILTRSDPEYPERLKQRLGSKSPAVLFGSGNKSLLNSGGIAVVGSRDASEEDLLFTEKLGKNAAKQGYSIVSGGARGVDQSAMLSALESEGTVVGVLSDRLLKSVTSAKFRKRIMSNDLVLISPFNPEAGFNVGNAMSRNQYIYCLSDAAIVVSSTLNKGGTWNGALEDLKNKWVPLWVKRNSSERSGNPEIVKRGACWLSNDNLHSLDTLLNYSQPLAGEEAPPALPLLASEKESLPVSEHGGEILESLSTESETVENEHTFIPAAEFSGGVGPQPADEDFYRLFLKRTYDMTATAPMKREDITKYLGLKKSQVDEWLDRGISEGKIQKSKRPVRYQSVQQGRLFEDGR